MNPEPSCAEALFLAAVEIAAPRERAAFLDRECGDDHALRERLEALLASHDEAGDFLQAAAPSPEMEAEFARLKPEEAGERIGPYKLLQQIGEGGFGTVWMAEQEQPVRRRVALKIIKLGMDTKEVIARFEQERQALAMMDHPNIAKVFDAGATPFGRPFFVMELVRGIALTDYCDQASLPTADRLQLFIAVCQAVQHAHQKGIIHRDLKPSNILITLHDGVPVTKVIDFGVAKAIAARLTERTLFTRFEQMIGTPLYMSPEQAELSGLDIDTRSDIYSLGVLLYELLTGRTPVDAETLRQAGLDEIRRIIREQEPPRPSMFIRTLAAEARTDVAQHRQTDGAKLIGLIRGDLDWIVMKALEKDRTRRYEAAVELAKDVERHLADEPVLARPPSQFYRLRRLVKRNTLAFSAATALVLALVIGGGVSTWLFVRERKAHGAELAAGREQVRERARAEKEAERANRESASARSAAFRARQLAYAAHIQAAQFLLDAKQYTRVIELLQQDQPNPGEMDLRGIEWRYLWGCAHRDSAAGVNEIARVSDGEAPIPLMEWSLAPEESILGFAVDGASLWTAAELGEARQWKVGDGSRIRTLKIPELGRRDQVVSLGDEILSGTSNGDLRITSLETGEISHSLRLPGADIFPIKVSLNRRFAALIYMHTALLIWDLQTGERVAGPGDFDASGIGMGNKIAFSPDSELFAYVRKGNGLECGKTSGGGMIAVIGDDSSEISSLAFSPDHRFLAIGTVAGGLKLVNAPRSSKDGGIILKLVSPPTTFSGHAARITEVQFSPDGRTLLTTGMDGVRLWSLETGQELMAFAGISSVHISGDGNVMAWHLTQQSQDRVRVIRLPTLKEIDGVKWKIPPRVQPVSTATIRG